MKPKTANTLHENSFVSDVSIPFVSDLSAPFDLSLTTTTWTTLHSSPPIQVMPVDENQKLVNSPKELSFVDNGGSMLVRAYAAQEQIRDNKSR